MICPECQAAEKQSAVVVLYGEGTCVGWMPFYDQEGNFHSHDPNQYRTHYRCSHGHEWTGTAYKECWCGWKRE